MSNLNEIDYEFSTALKVFPTKGNLVYEYNPFRNYRIELDMLYYNNRLWTYEEFCIEFYNIAKGLTFNEYKEIIAKNIQDSIWGSESPPVIYLKGQLVDFETDELNFNLNNPVNITPLWSYDNSVNLIINDGKNAPRLINSRFSPTERNKYLICDRKGNNDTNIYNLGTLFDLDTSLYRKTTTIPRLNFLGVQYGGRLGIGNYHFYFRYVDEDGNETDYFAESGLVSIFVGYTPDSIYSGFRNENSHKLVKFYLTNTDPGYYKVVVYYTVATSDINENSTITAKRINLEYLINQSSNTILTITGFENTTEVPLSDINPIYLIYGSVETQATCLNMLFLANVDRPEIPYNDLADCALRFLPLLETELYNSNIDEEYSGSASNNYYDPNYIYNKVGYWDDEIYRFGIVFIQADNTLTPVFNTRGLLDLSSSTKVGDYTSIEFKKNDERFYIAYNEETQILEKGHTLENVKGVISINLPDSNLITGINFTVPKEVVDYLKDTLHIKGYFFVRLKRMPTTLCQAYTIATDIESHTPVLPVDNVASYDKEGATSNYNYIAESFLSLRNFTSSDEDYSKSKKGKKIKTLGHTFSEHLVGLTDSYVKKHAAICPDYDVNSPYLNSLFTGSEFSIRPSSQTVNLVQSSESRHFYVKSQQSWNKSSEYTKVRIIGVEDNVKLVGIGSEMFSARAGEAEEAFRYEYIGREQKITEGVNLLRGSFGPYLGITGYEEPGSLIDIKIPGYSKSNMDSYFKIRYADKSSYYAISYRIDLSNLNDWMFEETYNIKTEESEEETETKFYKLNSALYRGDCYICLFTHRVNRNFLDPSAPNNNIIADPTCWRENFEVSDGIVKKENFDKINLGDVNAVGLGMWVTFTVRSTFNLNIRALDSSVVDEMSLFGHARGFYPYHPITTSGAYKIPEALCFNKGFETSVSLRWNYEVPDVPWIKNEFSNRIAYSDIQVTDGFRNGFRNFRGYAYRDYPKTYGSITKIIELNGNLLCVFEHGVGLISVNERTLAGSGQGGNVYVNTSNVLPENPKILSDTFGSLWRESVIKTPRAIYGVDTVGKKIWKTDGNTFDIISDMYILEFLHDNISLTERELTPIIGIRNVKTHYNAYKSDVMFTFYDNLHGFEEKVWNICFNEILKKWITFYSWVPSYSENIYNLFFSFDRNTSKWIAKLGISKSDNAFSDGVTLDNVIIESKESNTYEPIGKLSLSNRIINNLKYTLEYELVRDNYGHYTKDEDFKIIDEEYLAFNYSKYNEYFNKNEAVILLNIRCNIIVDDTYNTTLALAFSNTATIDAGYYESTIALCFKDKLANLTTDFWKHGNAGIIDIKDSLKPTYWYGKQHPFELEFIVAENPAAHKIFDDLEIISNNAEPESFHYEIIGDCFDFAKDKLNMYIRLEATKEFFLYNGQDIVFDDTYADLTSIHRPLKRDDGTEVTGYYDKSTILPLYYFRLDTINEIEDSYHLRNDINTKDFSAKAGAEIVHYNTLLEYRIWNHALAVDLRKGGRLRGNMLYKEDKWDVLINPINIAYKNEDSWDKNDLAGRNTSADKVPIEVSQFHLPETLNQAHIPSTFDDRSIVRWVNYKTDEIKLKDKWIKIRIRYSGEKLAIIAAIKTLYSISYG